MTAGNYRRHCHRRVRSESRWDQSGCSWRDEGLRHQTGLISSLRRGGGSVGNTSNPPDQTAHRRRSALGLDPAATPTTDELSWLRFNPLTPTVAIWVQLWSILCQTGLSRLCDFWHPGTDAQGWAWASECPDVKNYKWRLNPSRSDTGCFIAVPIWQQWASSG